MKIRFILAIATLLFNLSAYGENEVLKIAHGSVTDYAPVADIDSIYFDTTGQMMLIQPFGESGPIQIPYPEISEIIIISAENCPTKISVSYNENEVSIENPFLLEGVRITTDGAYVTVNNTNTDTEYTTQLYGTTTNGGFTYYGSYKTTIELCGVSITSQKGAAIDIECGKRVELDIKKETVNTLADCIEGEQKAALYCKGHLEIDKAGTLSVTGNTKHGISAKEYIELKKSEGFIYILAAKGDGIHCQGHFVQKGFTLNIGSTEDDGIQVEKASLDEGETYEEEYANGSLTIVDGTLEIKSTQNGGVESGETYSSSCLKADQYVDILGGKLTLANSGKISKAIKAGNSENEGTVTISGGDLTVKVTGDMYLSGTEASYSTAIKADNYVGNGGNITITAATGKAIHAISADNSVNITNGTYSITSSSAGYKGTSDTYTSKGITCDSNIDIEGGTLTIKMTGTGGKGIKADGQFTMGKSDGTGPTLNVATTGAGVGSSSTGGGGGPGGPGGHGGGGGQSSVSSSSKAIKALGIITLNGGNLFVSTATTGAEGVESKKSVTINGGNHYIKCYDDCINSAGIINFAGGNTVCYGMKNDAVDSNYGKKGAITISGGNVFAYSTAGDPEEGIDCDNSSYIVVTGGMAISAGGQQGGGGGGWGGGSSSSSVGSSTQGYFIGASPSSYQSSYYYTLCNTSGKAMCTYKFEANVTNKFSLLTATELGKGSVTVKRGTTAPTECDSSVKNVSGTGVFFINPTVTTTATAATVTAK